MFVMIPQISFSASDPVSVWAPAATALINFFCTSAGQRIVTDLEAAGEHIALDVIRFVHRQIPSDSPKPAA